MSDTTQIVFPDQLRSHPKTPVIMFYAKDPNTNDDVRISLPCPPAISFADGAEFNTLDLGFIKGDLGKDFMSGNLAGAAERAKSITAGQILDIISKQTPKAELIAFARKNIVNPNTNTTFVGNRLRSFGFNFKLIASSQKESAIIRNIHTSFRRFTYAKKTVDANDFTLAFPPTWSIKFMDFGSGAFENQYIPKIYECYLTQVESTFNSDANIFYSDSAPLQVDITLQFQETRVLTRSDIEEMKRVQMGEIGLDKNGLPNFDDIAGGLKKAASSAVSDVKKTINKFTRL